MTSPISLFISDAVAADITQSTTPNQLSFASFVPLILILLVFYVLLIRPQQKKIKEHQKLVDNLKVGDKICTIGGLFGIVKNIDANLVDIEISKDVVVKILRNTIGEVVKDQEENKKEKKSKTKNKK